MRHLRLQGHGGAPFALSSSTTLALLLRNSVRPALGPEALWLREGQHVERVDRHLCVAAVTAHHCDHNLIYNSPKMTALWPLDTKT